MGDRLGIRDAVGITLFILKMSEGELKLPHLLLPFKICTILPGFEPGIFCSVGRRVIRCATGPAPCPLGFFYGALRSFYVLSRYSYKCIETPISFYDGVSDGPAPKLLAKIKP